MGMASGESDVCFGTDVGNGAPKAPEKKLSLQKGYFFLPHGNAMHAVRTQCEVLDVGKYSNPSFGPFSQVFGSVPGFFWLPKHLGCGIFELSTISP